MRTTSTLPVSVQPPGKAQDANATAQITSELIANSGVAASQRPCDARRNVGLHPFQKSLLLQTRRQRQSAAKASPGANANGALSSSLGERLDAGLDATKVASNALMSGASIAASFGLLGAANNIARLHPNPAVKVAGAFAPVVAGVASAYIAQGIRDAFEIESTASRSTSYARDAATPAVFVAVNYAYAFSRWPKFSPKTPAGVATTLAVSAIGSGIGGGLSELIAQTIPESATAMTPETHSRPTTWQVGVGRSITQVPALVLNKVMAAAAVNGAIPRPLALALPITIGLPFVFRKSVTPTTPLATPKPFASHEESAELGHRANANGDQAHLHGKPDASKSLDRTAH